MRQRLDEAILDGIKGVGFIAEQPIRDSVGHEPVTAEQFILGAAIPADGRR